MQRFLSVFLFLLSLSLSLSLIYNPLDMITVPIMDVHRISIEPLQDEWTQGRPRTRQKPERAHQRRITAPSSLRCVSVCCTRNGRHVLAVTHARRHTHTRVDLRTLLILQASQPRSPQTSRLSKYRNMFY